MRMRNVLLFFAIACALTAVCQTPGILALRAGEQPTPIVVLLMVVGAAGPTLVAVLFSRIERRPLFRRPVQTKRRLPLGLLAVAHPFIAHMIASAALIVVGQYTAKHYAYPPLLPEQIAIAILAPVGEEYGWRGYALPRLQAVMSPVAASALIGVVWACWHLPTMWMPGATFATFAVFIPMMIAGSIIYTWLFNASGGSMLVIVLAHLGIHLDNVVRADAMGDGLSPAVSTMIVLCIFAGVLVATGRLRRDAAVTA